MNALNELKEISLIIAGQWNANIFNPNFVLKEIFCLPDGKEAEIGIDNGNFTLITKFKNVSLIPSHQIIELKISNEFDEETISFASQATLNVLKLFPYVPKLALGVNFRFDSSASLLSHYDSTPVGEFHFTQATISRDMGNCKQNLIVDKAYTLFNFHYNDPSLFTPNCISKNLNEAIKLWTAL